jgi:hypothetical protein
MSRLFYIASIFFSILFSRACAQGCSDAGFCTAGAMQSGGRLNDTANERNSAGISLTMGIGENGTTILVPQAEGKFHLSSQTYIEGKFPVNIASGNLGAHAGIGDPVVTCSHIIARHSQVKYIGSVGARIGIGNANATDRGKALPMPYQSSLGTTDIIAGIGVSLGKYISASAGYQQPVLQYNANGYVPAIINPSAPGDLDYFASKNLRRKGDILIRAEGHYQRRKVLISAGPLFIYHLGEDTYETAVGERTALSGSSGATLNIAASLSYTMKAGRIDMQGGEPLIVRSYRPDGLTRSIVVTLRYTRF